nr:MAG TPA: hypothetical protein [Caudoviricetes sp.]
MPHKNLKKHKTPYVGGLISSTRYLMLCLCIYQVFLCGMAKIRIKNQKKHVQVRNLCQNN